MDGFGNHVFIGHIQDYHQYFEYEVVGTAQVDGMQVQKEPLRLMYKYPSKYTGYTKERIREFYKAIGRLKGTDLEKAVTIMQYLHEHFTYVSGVTDIYTTAAEALKQREAYARIMLIL